MIASKINLFGNVGLAKAEFLFEQGILEVNHASYALYFGNILLDDAISFYAYPNINWELGYIEKNPLDLEIALVIK